MPVNYELYRQKVEPFKATRVTAENVTELAASFGLSAYASVVYYNGEIVELMVDGQRFRLGELITESGRAVWGEFELVEPESEPGAPDDDDF